MVSPKINTAFVDSKKHPNIIFKGKTRHGFNSCIVISDYPLGKPSIKKGTEYRNN